MDRWEKFEDGTGEEERELALVLIRLTHSSTAYACLRPSIYVTGHMEPVKCSFHGVGHASTSRMSSEHLILVVVKDCSSQPSGYEFRQRATYGCSPC